MPRRRPKPLPTIWRAPDDLWRVVERVLKELDPPKRTGRKRNYLPREFPDDSSVHRTFQRWVKLGVFDRIWAVLLEACEDLGSCDWEWQAADTSMGKARMGGTSSARIRRTVPRTA